MSFANELAQTLLDRLPELEWKLSTLNFPINLKMIPHSLFRNRLEITPQSCISEIKSDIESLQCQTNVNSIHYLAERVHRKISVLVALCQFQKEEKSKESSVNFGLQAISTRQQWIQSLQHDILILQEQQKAMESTLSQLEKSSDAKAILNLQGELGEVKRRLTLAKETLERA